MQHKIWPWTNQRSKLWYCFSCAQGKNFVRPLGCFFQPRDPGSSANKISPNMGEFTHLKISCCSGAEVWRWAQKAGFSITLPNKCIQAGRVQPGVPQCILFVFIWTLALGAVAADLYLPSDWVTIKELHLQCVPWQSVQWGAHLCDKHSRCTSQCWGQERTESIAQTLSLLPSAQLPYPQFLPAELDLCLCSKHEFVPIRHSGIGLEYIATLGHVQWRYHC